MERTGKDAIIWTDDTLNYIRGAQPDGGGYICEAPLLNVTISNLHVFGTNASRPYLLDNILKTHNNVLETDKRIQLGLQLYISYPIPDVIMFHFLLWDFQYLYRAKVTVNDTISPY
jgi:hypothetical protein